MSRPAAHTDRLIALDGLRGVASLVVLTQHLVRTLPYFAPFVLWDNGNDPRGALQWFLFRGPPRLLWAGQNAVIVFFVLSGFVLSLAWLTGHAPSYRRFVTARVCRIYLPYLAIMLIAWALAEWLRHQPGATAGEWANVLGWTDPTSTATLPSVLLMLGNYSSRWIDPPIWSLVWEMRVSLLFPLLVAPIMAFGLRGTLTLIVVLAIVWVGANSAMEMAPALNALLYRPQETFYYAGFFVLGCTLARYRAPLAAFGGRGDGSYAMGLLVAGLICCGPYWPIQHGTIVGVGAGLLIVAAISKGRPQAWFTARPIQWLGRVSYSLYLVHVPVILTAEYLLFGKIPAVAIVVAVFPVCLLGAELFYRAVERPSMLLGRELGRRMVAVAQSKIA